MELNVIFTTSICNFTIKSISENLKSRGEFFWLAPWGFSWWPWGTSSWITIPTPPSPSYPRHLTVRIMRIFMVSSTTSSWISFQIPPSFLNLVTSRWAPWGFSWCPQQPCHEFLFLNPPLLNLVTSRWAPWGFSWCPWKPRLVFHFQSPPNLVPRHLTVSTMRILRVLTVWWQS